MYYCPEMLSSSQTIVPAAFERPLISTTILQDRPASFSRFHQESCDFISLLLNGYPPVRKPRKWIKHSNVTTHGFIPSVVYGFDVRAKPFVRTSSVPSAYSLKFELNYNRMPAKRSNGILTPGNVGRSRSIHQARRLFNKLRHFITAGCIDNAEPATNGMQPG